MGNSISKNLKAAASERMSRAQSISKMSEKELEEMDRERALKGLTADLVMVYPIESEDILRQEAASGEEPAASLFGKMQQKRKRIKVKYEVNKKVLDKLNERMEHRANLIIKLQQAGLSTVLSRSLDGTKMYLKIWANYDRLVQEATRQGMEMLVDPEIAKHQTLHELPADGFMERTCDALGLKTCADLIFGKDETPRTYRDFDPDELDDYKRKNGRLFSSLERQRLIYAILEGAEDIGGAQQDLDGLVADKALESFVWPHSGEKDTLWYRWGAMDEMGPITGNLQTKVPDAYRFLLWILLTMFYVLSLFMQPFYFDLACGITLGILVGLAGFLGMSKQPIDDVRDYFGEKTAFYFAWMEHYSQYLIYLSLMALVAIAAGASVMPPVKEDDDTSMQENSAYAKLVYCIVVAVWTTAYMESWKRRNAVLAYVWDVTDFEEEEDPRPEFLANFYTGRFAHENEGGGCCTKEMKMKEEPGFFTSDVADKQKYFPSHQQVKIKAVAVPQLLLMTGIMVVGAVGILIFKMLVQVGSEFRSDPFWSGAIGSNLPMIMSMLWIVTMNGFYVKLATALNDLENYRTETEYQDQLILKVVVFQFINSYISLLYIAFLKAAGSETFVEDPQGKPYRDLCGFIPGSDPDASWADVQAGNFHYANRVPECSPGLYNDTCCNFGAETLVDSHCEFVFVQRDCSSDLRKLLVSYTLLKAVYDGLLQILVPMIMMAIAQYKLLKKWTEDQGGHLLGAESTTASSGKTHGVHIEMDARSSQASAPPSPPPSPPEQMKVELRSEKTRGPRTASQKVDDFHKSIEIELANERYPGTLQEYSTKVIQFGYIAMFSAAFPIAAISSAVGNFIELRLDAIKALTLRRRRYEGAEDIGSWQSVLAFMSWVALPMNVALFVFTSWTFRQYVLAPSISDDSCGPAEPYVTVGAYPNTGTPFTLTAAGHANYEATLSLRSLYVEDNGAMPYANQSFVRKCEQNVNDCWAPVGGVPWLPALDYLVTSSNPKPSTTIFLMDAVCDTGSALYNKLHCETCRGWAFEILYLQMLTFIIVEHVLLMLKMFLAYLVPDVPRWVQDAAARADFQKSIKKEMKVRRMSTDGLSDQEMREREERKVAKLKADIESLKDRLNDSTDGSKPRSMSGFV
eukprot:CAMPEP_0115874298 /NCGR_PEP_ID=MMETSP0287-20121206/24462_1 /TAXON_ID=412157 /ORGANISM="Chrysochromulina rotalis, Strain UIO044" /LENGTH=1141 /DNA_ID=CAMNT_0003329431 /DNA_START=17 /DNA_END=3442 /DNA_ORIENTATION=-